jgi:hypothetical protein
MGRLHNLFEKNGVNDVNFEMTAVNKVYKVSVSVCFVSEGQVSQPLIFTLDEVVSKRIVFLISGDLQIDYYDSLLPVENSVLGILF